MAATAIQVKDLCKQYGSISAVDRVSFEIGSGELVGFLGLNGAGKTTTIRILTTFLPASSGTATINGFDVMYQSMEVRSSLGYLPESVPLYPEMRVEEYLIARAKLKGVDRSTRTSRIDYCLERCRIREVRQRLIGTLSKGYRQRVGLADTLLADPKVLILDEPLSGLDPIQQDETLKTIKDLSGQHTVLFSSHQLSDVEKICDRVMIIHRGRLEFDARLSELAKISPTLFLEARGPADSIEASLMKLDSVTAIRRGTSADDTTSFEIEVKTDISEVVAKTIVANSWGIRRLVLRQARLEETFMRVAYQRN